MTRRRGFSFAEILFAVMILGIGFIMVAAMFPVAIKQTERNGQETTAANMGAAAVSNFEQMAVQLNQQGLLPTDASTSLGPVPPGTLIHSPVWLFHDPRITKPDPANPSLLVRDEMWNAVSGNLILPSDPRYAWVPMYRRDLTKNAVGNIFPSPMIQLILIGVQTRNQPKYTPQRDLVPQPPTDPAREATLQGHLFSAVITAPSTALNQAVGLIQFIPDNSATGPFELNRIAEGTYAVISDEGQPYTPPSPGAPTWPPGAFNGRIIKVGAFRPDMTAKHPNQPTYELVPGYDLPCSPFPSLTLNNATVIVVGRGLRDPANKIFGCDGGVQDISVYTTLVRVQ